MKKRVLALILGMVMCLSIVFTSCSLGGKDIFDLYKDTPVDQGTEYGTSAAVTLAGGENEIPDALKSDKFMTTTEVASSTAGTAPNVVTTTKTTYRLYSLLANKKLAEITVTKISNVETKEGDVVAPMFYIDGDYAAVQENKYEKDEATYTVYDAEGTAVIAAFTAEKTSQTLKSYDNHVLVNNLLYRRDVDKEGVVTYNKIYDFDNTTLDTSKLAKVIFTGETYVALTSDDGVTVFDANFAVISHTDKVAYNTEEDATVVLLSNGNVLIQYKMALPEDATDYDLFDDGEKFDLNYVLVKTNGSVSNVKDLGYLITDVELDGADDKEDSVYNASEKEVIVTANKIIDGIYDKKDLTLSINNNGKATEIDIPDGWEDITAVKSGMFVVEYTYGTYLYNAKGTELALFTSDVKTFMQNYAVLENDTIVAYGDEETEEYLKVVYELGDDETIVGTIYTDIVLLTEACEKEVAKKDAQGNPTKEMVSVKWTKYSVLNLANGTTPTVLLNDEPTTVSGSTKKGTFVVNKDYYTFKLEEEVTVAKNEQTGAPEYKYDKIVTTYYNNKGAVLATVTDYAGLSTTKMNELGFSYAKVETEIAGEDAFVIIVKTTSYAKNAEGKIESTVKYSVNTCKTVVPAVEE